MSNPSQQNFGFDQTTDHLALLELLRHEYHLPQGKKSPYQYVLILSKKDEKHVVPIPSFKTFDYDFYIQLKKVVLIENKFVCDTVVSGLSLMVGHYHGVIAAIINYNVISKNIGDYKLFGEIESMVDLSTNRAISFSKKELKCL